MSELTKQLAEIADRTEAELRFARADNARLIEENKQLGARLNAARDHALMLEARLSAHDEQCHPALAWDGKCSICGAHLNSPLLDCQVCARNRAVFIAQGAQKAGLG